MTGVGSVIATIMPCPRSRERTRAQAPPIDRASRPSSPHLDESPAGTRIARTSIDGRRVRTERRRVGRQEHERARARACERRPRGAARGRSRCCHARRPRRGRTSAGRGRARRSGVPRLASRSAKARASSTIQRIGRSASPARSAFRRAQATVGREAVDVRDGRSGGAPWPASPGPCRRTGAGRRAVPRGVPTRRSAIRARSHGSICPCSGNRPTGRVSVGRSSSASPPRSTVHAPSARRRPAPAAVAIEAQDRLAPRTGVPPRAERARVRPVHQRSPNRSRRAASPKSTRRHVDRAASRAR